MIKLLPIFLILLLPMSSFGGASLSEIDYSFYAKFKTAKKAELKNLDDLTSNILSSKSKVYSSKDNAFLQEFIDKAYLTFFRLNSMKRMCSKVSSTEQSTMHLLGVSESRSKEIFNRCEKYLSESKNKKELIYRGSMSFKLYPKEYLFVIGSSRKLPLDSWTGHTSKTFIFIDHLFTKEDLYRMLLHEFSIAFDDSYMIEKTYYDTAMSQQNFQATLGLELIKSSLVKSTFGVMRAWNFEEEILSELKGRTKRKKDCVNVFTDTFTELARYQEYFINPKIDMFFNRIKKIDKKPYLLDKKTFREIPSYLRQFNFNIYIDNKEISFCDYFSTPNYIGNNSVFSRGPKPRVGGGWSHDREVIKDLDDLIELLDREDIKTP